MPLQLITPPTLEPVSLIEAQTQLKIDVPTWNDKITLLLMAARKFIEENLRRAMVTQTWELIESHFPNETTCLQSGALNFGFPLCAPYHRVRRQHREFPFIELPKGQLSSVTSVAYVDDAGVQQTLDPSIYSVDAASVPGRVHLGFGQTWPSHRRQWDAVRVRYIVGTPPAQVPEPLKQAILLLISQMWTNDVPEVTGTIIASVKFSYEALVGPYRIMTV